MWLVNLSNGHSRPSTVDSIFYIHVCTTTCILPPYMALSAVRKKDSGDLSNPIHVGHDTYMYLYLPIRRRP